METTFAKEGGCSHRELKQQQEQITGDVHFLRCDASCMLCGWVTFDCNAMVIGDGGDFKGDQRFKDLRCKLRFFAFFLQSSPLNSDLVFFSSFKTKKNAICMHR